MHIAGIDINFVTVTSMLNTVTDSTTIISDTVLTDHMHRAGIRPSVQRLAILGFVANKRLHPTADEIYSALAPAYPTLSRTTVYNTLHALVAGGLLRELEIESGNRRYDYARQESHSHFMCRRCGHIYDIPVPPRIDHNTPAGFRIDTVDIYFKGLCPACFNDTITN